jgi:hypothetical protein
MKAIKVYVTILEGHGVHQGLVLVIKVMKVHVMILVPNSLVGQIKGSVTDSGPHAGMRGSLAGEVKGSATSLACV